MEKTRRDVLYLTGTSVLAATAGCQTSTENTTSTERTTSTANTDTDTSNPNTPENEFSEEEGSSEEPVTDRTTFAEAYNSTVPGAGFDSLSTGEVQQVRDIAEDQSVSDALERTAEMLEGRLAATEGFKEVVHNDLGYSQDQVRVLERNHSDGSPYAAVMIKDEDGDWIKDLMAFTGKEEGYLRHDENSLDTSREQGLFDLWKEDFGVSTATSFFRNLEQVLGFGDREERSKSAWNKPMRRIAKRNDHIVVGDNEETGEVCYSKDGARAVANIQDFDDHQVFNKEMEMVENVTEFYHNDLGDGYVQVDVTSEGLGDGQVELTELDSGEVLYAEEVGEEAYDEAVLSLYEAEN